METDGVQGSFWKDVEVDGTRGFCNAALNADIPRSTFVELLGETGCCINIQTRPTKLIGPISVRETLRVVRAHVYVKAVALRMEDSLE